MLRKILVSLIFFLFQEIRYKVIDFFKKIQRQIKLNIVDIRIINEKKDI